MARRGIRPAEPVVDDLFAGECDRAGFIQRATMFGLSVPVMSAALLAAGEAPAAFAKETRGKAGGRIRVGLTPIPKGTLEPWTYQETAALQMGGISGEFLNRNRPNLTLAARAGGQLEAERHRQQWTYKLRQGVKFANGKPMTADDVVATYTPPAHRPDLAGRLRLQRRALDRRRDEGRRLHRPVQAGHADGELPVPHELVDVPGDHPAQELRRAVRDDAADDRRLQPRRVHPGRQRPLRPQPELVGRLGAARRRRRDARRADRDQQRAASAASSTCSTASSTSTAARSSATRTSRSSRPVARRTARSRCASIRRRAVKDTRVRQAIALTLNRPQIIKTLFNGKADLGNDSPFAPVYPSTAGRPAAPQGHPPGQAAASRRPASRRASRRSSSRTRRPSCRASRRSSSRARSRSAATSTSRSSPARSTTRARPTHDAVAERADDDHRLGPSRRAERAAQRGAHEQGDPEQEGRHLERGALQEQEVRRARQVRSARLPRWPTRGRSRRQIELLLLAETPVIFPYFYNSFNAGSPKVKGYQVDQLGEIYLSKTSLS